MTTQDTAFIMRNSVFAWLVLATCLILTVPLIAMQVTADVNWSVMDFLVMGVLLMGTGSLYVLVARRVPSRRRLALGIVFAAALLYVWAELAVGIFTHLGS